MPEFHHLDVLGIAAWQPKQIPSLLRVYPRPDAIQRGTPQFRLDFTTSHEYTLPLLLPNRIKLTRDQIPLARTSTRRRHQSRRVWRATHGGARAGERRNSKGGVVRSCPNEQHQLEGRNNPCDLQGLKRRLLWEEMCGGEDQDQPLVQPVELKVFSKKKMLNLFLNIPLSACRLNNNNGPSCYHKSKYNKII
jgi:hypothetical protein